MEFLIGRNLTLKLASVLAGLLCLLSVPVTGDGLKAGVSALKRNHYATAMRAWLPLAEQGSAQAQNNLGHLYEEGFGVAQNYTQAMSWYKKAALQGLAEAQHNVGMLYYQGYGVRQNYRSARKWFNLAAQQDLAESQYMLGLAYYLGRGVSQDNLLARQWFYKSAKQDYGNSQLMFAYMTQAGDGTEPQPQVALVWALLADKNGIPDARDVAYHAELLLEEQEIASAKQLFQQCLSTQLEQCSG